MYQIDLSVALPHCPLGRAYFCLWAEAPAKHSRPSPSQDTQATICTKPTKLARLIERLPLTIGTGRLYFMGFLGKGTNLPLGGLMFAHRDHPSKAPM